MTLGVFQFANGETVIKVDGYDLLEPLVRAAAAAADRAEAATSETVTEIVGDPAPVNNGSSGSGVFAVNATSTNNGDAIAVRLSSVGVRTVPLYQYRLSGGTLTQISSFSVAGDGTSNQRVTIAPVDWQTNDYIAASAADVHFVSDGTTTPGSYYLGTSAPSSVGTSANIIHMMLGVEVQHSDQIDFATRFAALQADINALGGGALTKNMAMWGDSLTAYIQAPSQSAPAQLATILGQSCYNGGVSGETSTQIRTRFTAASAKYGYVTIFKVGRNNFSFPDTVMADLKAMFALLTPAARKRALVLPVWNGQDEYVGGSSANNYANIMALNERMQKAYPDNYIDTRRHIVLNGLSDNGLTPTSQDLIDIGHDVIPTQTRIDFLHGNQYAYASEARCIAGVIQSRGWLA